MNPAPSQRRGIAEGFSCDELLTPAEVALAFRVHPKQVTRWADAGKLRTVRTLGNQRRFFKAEVDAFLHPPLPRRVPGAALDALTGEES